MSRSRSARAPRPKEAYHHGDLRRALLDATLELVRKNGPQGFTLRAAARAAGVTPGATYHHFESKDALLAAVAEEGFEMFGAELKAAARAPAATPLERSRKVGVAYVLFAIQHPTRFRIMVGIGVGADRRRGAVPKAAREAYLFVRQTLIDALDAGSAETISEAEILGWWSVVHGLAFLAIDGHLGKAASSPELAEKTVYAVIAALDARIGP